MSRDQEIVDVALDYVAESDRALLMTDGRVERWIPKSLVQNMDEVKRRRGVCSTLLLPEWFAKKEDLI